VTEEILNTAVWGALEEAISNPDLVIQNIAKLREHHKAQLETAASQVSDAKQALERLNAEESRILEAYRLEIITAEQLSQEMQKLSERRNSLQSRYDSLRKAQDSPVPETEIRDSVAEFCEKIGKRIASTGIEERQQLLRFIVREVVFDGAMVQVRAVIPMDSRSTPVTSSVSSCGVTDTGSHCRSHNSADIGNMEFYCHGRNTTVEFLIAKPVLRNARAVRP
jgi:hypothetical protein